MIYEVKNNGKSEHKSRNFFLVKTKTKFVSNSTKITSNFKKRDHQYSVRTPLCLFCTDDLTIWFLVSHTLMPKVTNEELYGQRLSDILHSLNHRKICLALFILVKKCECFHFEC